MKILMISAPYKPTPPWGYAGIERVVFWYVRELLERGHDVTTICTPGSTVPGKKIIWDPCDLPEAAHIREPVMGEWFQELIGTWDDLWDVVHDHSHLKYPAIYCDEIGFPFLNTVHLPNPLFKKNAVALSQAHKEEVSPTAEVINLGVPVEDYPFRAQKSDYALYLGYIAPHKGVSLALRAARALDIPLILAGPTEHFPDYFKKEIGPLLDEKRRFIGEVGGSRKLDLLRGARFVVMPILWEEPGSTVCFEALACGTPVVGFERGALKDIVTRDAAGRLVNDYQGLVNAMKEYYELMRFGFFYSRGSRYHVEQHFSIPSRIDLYEALYRRVLDGEIW